MYDPENVSDRVLLASALKNRLVESKFTLSLHHSSEDVYTFVPLESISVEGLIEKKPSNFRINVFTSIENAVIRKKDSDAIRVSLIWSRNGLTLPILKEKRVYRKGEIPEIVERTMERCRNVYKELQGFKYCHCKAPLVLSKKGNIICIERCWLR
jgi:hypothetical protein